jgi:hypothetical protein
MYQIAIYIAEHISEANRRRKKQVYVTKWHQYNNKSLAKGDMAKMSIAKKIV